VPDPELDAAVRRRLAGALLRAAAGAEVRDVPQAELLLPLDGPRVLEIAGADGRMLGFALVGATLFELHDEQGLQAFLHDVGGALDPLALILLVGRYRLPALVGAEQVDVVPDGLAVEGRAILFATDSGGVRDRWRLVTGSGAALERVPA
jgi:hypothetical protein